MVEYLFVDEVTGELVDVTMSVDDAVPIGEVREIDGRLLRRMVSISGVQVEPGWGHAAYGMSADERRIAGPRDRDGNLRTDSLGHVVFANRREIEEGNARLKAAGLSYQYDFGAHARKKGKRVG